MIISIHALREEGDRTASVRTGSNSSFLSTPSVRRATATVSALKVVIFISIHALREEGDCPVNCQQDHVCAISIHALREEGDG